MVKLSSASSSAVLPPGQVVAAASPRRRTRGAGVSGPALRQVVARAVEVGELEAGRRACAARRAAARAPGRPRRCRRRRRPRRGVRARRRPRRVEAFVVEQRGAIAHRHAHFVAAEAFRFSVQPSATGSRSGSRRTRPSARWRRRCSWHRRSRSRSAWAPGYDTSTTASRDEPPADEVSPGSARARGQRGAGDDGAGGYPPRSPGPPRRCPPGSGCSWSASRRRARRHRRAEARVAARPGRPPRPGAVGQHDPGLFDLVVPELRAPRRCGGPEPVRRHRALAATVGDRRAGDRPDAVFLMAGRAISSTSSAPTGPSPPPGDPAWTEHYVADVRELSGSWGRRCAPVVAVKPTCFGPNTLPDARGGGAGRAPRPGARPRGHRRVAGGGTRANGLHLLDLDALTCPAAWPIR